MFSHETHPLACVRVGKLQQWRLAMQVCSGLTPLIEEYPAQGALVLALRGSERLLLGRGGAATESAMGSTASTGTTDSMEAPEHIWPLLGEALTRLLAEIGAPGDGLAIGIGSTRTLAWLASCSGVTVVLPGEEGAFLAALPVTVLLETPDAAEVPSLAGIVVALETAGIRTLGQAQRLSREALTRRFGVDGATFAALADGGDVRPLRPRNQEQWLGARLAFEPSLAAQHLAVALGPLAERLALTLARRELAAGKIALALEGEAGGRLQVIQRLAHPLGTTRALLGAAERLLAGLLADTKTTHVAAEASQILPDVALPEDGERYITMRLRLGGLHQVTAEQRRLWAAEQRQAGTERIERLAAALRALSGGKHADELLRAEIHEPDAVLPEERYRMTPRTSRAL